VEPTGSADNDEREAPLINWLARCDGGCERVKYWFGCVEGFSGGSQEVFACGEDAVVCYKVLEYCLQRTVQTYSHRL
jgi:hypothetical protein